MDHIEAAISRELVSFSLLPDAKRTAFLKRALDHAYTVLNQRKLLRNDRQKSQYFLKKEDWSESLKADFEHYSEFRWQKTRDPDLEYRLPVQREVTLYIHSQQVSAFAGFCLNPEGVPEQQPLLLDQLGLAMYLATATFESYRTFYAARGNAPHGQLLHIRFAKSLFHPVTGYLTQHPEMAATIKAVPELRVKRTKVERKSDRTSKPFTLPELDLDEWEAACERAYQYYGKLFRDLNASKEDYIGMEGVMPLITIEQDGVLPLDRVQQMVDDMADYTHRRFSPASIGFSIMFRDMLLIKMAMEMPLRAKHWSMLRLEPKTIEVEVDGKKEERILPQNIFKEGNRYRCEIELDDFKNHEALKARHNNLPYIFEFTDELSAMIDEYLRIHRPRLLKRKKVEELFVTRNGTKFLRHNASVIMEHRTSQFLAQGAPFGRGGVEGLLSFRIHAMRYIVASDCVRRTAGDFELAALLLADSVEVVRRVYAFLNPSETKNRMLQFSTQRSARYRENFS